MTVFVLSDVDMNYGKSTMVGVFSTKVKAEKYITEHPSAPTVTRWTDRTDHGQRKIDYHVEEVELDKA